MQKLLYILGVTVYSTPSINEQKKSGLLPRVASGCQVVNYKCIVSDCSF